MVTATRPRRVSRRAAISADPGATLSPQPSIGSSKWTTAPARRAFTIAATNASGFSGSMVSIATKPGLCASIASCSLRV